MKSKIALSLIALASSTALAAAPSPMARVEKGLLPAVTMIGEPTRTMSIAERMAHYQVPAVSIAVIDRNRIVWSHAWGRLGRGAMRPATVGTLFQAGSLSKPVTAAAALALVRDGRLSLDSPVNDYLTSWKVPPSDLAQGKTVTLRNILSHSAGFGVGGFKGYVMGSRLPSLREILDGAGAANSPPVRIEQAPGSAFRYSGGGYLVAQQAMEDVTRHPFARIMSDTILRPLGMSSSSYAQPLPPARALLAAIGHKAGGVPAEGRWFVYPEQAAAGLWTTPTDLARFTLWLMNGLSADAPAAQRAVAGRLLEPQLDLPGGKKAGLGLVLDGGGPAPHFSHAGSTWGYRAFMIGFPETGQGAVLMANSDTSPDLIKEIVRALAEEYRWPERFHRMTRPVPVAAAALEALAGHYGFQPRDEASRTEQIVVAIADGSLTAELPDGTRYSLRAESPTRFFDPETETLFLFDQPGTLRMPARGIAARHL